MRLNRQYRAEASVLETSLVDAPDVVRHDRHRVFVLVDSVDLAEIEAMRYAKGLHADELTAVHFILDGARAQRLQERWQHFGHTTELRLIECADRNLSRAAHDLVLEVKRQHPDTKVTVLLPRREYAPLVGRLLHDQTADKVARVISRIPDASAQIMAYDIESRIAQISRAGGDSPGRPSAGDSRIDVPQPQ
jgi:hypothetical protein